MRFSVVIWVVGFALPLFTHASVDTKPLEKLLVNVQKASGQNTTQQQVHERLIENEFLFQELNRYSATLVTRQSQVGFSNRYHAEQLAMTLLINNFGDIDYQSLKPQQTAPFDKVWLTKAIGTYPVSGVYDNSTLSTLDSIQLKGLPFAVSMKDIVETLSMQKRLRLHQGETQVLYAELERRFRLLQLQNAHTKKLKDLGISYDALYHVALTEIVRAPAQAYFGLKQQMHGERSEYVEHLKGKISNADVSNFYKENKARFRYVTSVEAWAGLFSSRKLAEQCRHLAQDKAAPQAILNCAQDKPLELLSPTIKRETIKDNWAAQAAFNLPENALSQPIRTPDGKWLVIATGKRAYDYYLENSETVKYQATIALLTQVALKTFEDKFNRWKQTL
ncbi:peptidyl-prolyl cis-trans isomerase [Pseudoalteromonas xiamenensis]